MMTVVFHIETEFHFLVSRFILSQHFSSANVKAIYLVSVVNGNWPKRIDAFIGKVERIEVNLSADGYRLVEPYEQLVEKLKRTGVEEYISFLNMSPLSLCLVSSLGKARIRCALAPDGLAAYNVYNWKIAKSRIKESARFLQFVRANRIPLYRMRYVSYEYSRNASYDFLYSFEMPLPTNRSKLAEKKVKLWNDRSVLDLTDKLFSVDRSVLPVMDKVVLLIGQSYNGSLGFESELISLIHKNFPETVVYYKIHPNQRKQLDHQVTSEFPNLRILTLNFPAELLISHLNTSAVLSAFSTSQLFEKEGCRSIWFYPVRPDITTYNGIFNFVKPANHIEVVHSFQDLVSSLDFLKRR